MSAGWRGRGRTVIDSGTLGSYALRHAEDGPAPSDGADCTDCGDVSGGGVSPPAEDDVVGTTGSVVDATPRRFTPGTTHSLPRAVHFEHGYVRSHLILDSEQGMHDLRRERLLQ